MVSILLPNGKIIKRKPIARTLGNFCQLYIRYKNQMYAIGDGDEYLRGAPDVFKLNYLSTGEGKPQYILYPEQLKEIEEKPSLRESYYKNYIEVE